MPKIKLDREKCIGCGSCQAVCLKFFEMADDGKSHIKGSSPTNFREKENDSAVAEEKNAPKLVGDKDKNDVEELEVKKIECAESAAEVCPAQCIEIKK